MKSFVNAGALLAIGIVAAGCVTTREKPTISPEQMSAHLDGRPIYMHDSLRSGLLGGKQNEALQYLRAGTKAYEMGDFGHAAWAFDQALIPIETVYADNPEAAQARSNFTPEDYKDYRGEPYERMMAYYYRGLLYFQDGDYENARASFKSGMLQDSLSQSDVFKQDAASMAYLEGWASKCAGDGGLAKTAFDEALEYNDKLVVPETSHNLLLIVETGSGPLKIAQGEYKELLRFKESLRGKLPDSISVKIADDRDVDIAMTESLIYQATTRGGRQIDSILAGKAQFKSSVDTAGNVLLAAGATTTTVSSYNNNDGAAMAGLAIMVAGGLAKLIAAATTPEADLRRWETMPGRLFMSTAELPAKQPNDHQLAAIMWKTKKGEDEPTVKGEPIALRITGSDTCKIAWGREISSLSKSEYRRALTAKGKAEASEANPANAEGKI